MKPYELTYIISSVKTSQEADDLKKELETLVQTKGGVVIKSVKTVPQSLAYPIAKQRSGYFITLEFQTEEKEIKELKAVLEKDPNILRHVIIIKKPPKQMKARRTRKPVIDDKIKVKSETSQVYKQITKKEGVKVDLEGIDKKLDEILSE